VIAIVDYGMGNLRSAQKGFESAGHAATITDDATVIAEVDAVVLPGVGAYGDCYRGLEERGLVAPVKAAAASGRPFLGICVGMQLLFEESDEGGGAKGLGVLPGRIVRFDSAQETGLKVPHMGWNQLTAVPGRSCPLQAGIDENPYTYFVHSYYAVPSEDDVALATCEYGTIFPAVVGRGNVYATQFHPEKSQHVGIAMLRAFGNCIGESE
jgi:glutamine amidotransferase